MAFLRYLVVVIATDLILYMNITTLENLFKAHGFQNDEWKFWTQNSLQETSIKNYFERWSEKLQVPSLMLLSGEIEKRGLMSDFLEGLGAQEKRFFQSVESFHDFVKYGMPLIESPDTCSVYIPFASDGKDVAALAALLYEKWPFARWKLFAEERNAIIASRAQRLEFSVQEIQHSSGAYFQAGGQKEWQQNFVVDHEKAELHEQLKKRIRWNDDLEGQKFDVIFCPNVLIKMNASYRNQVLQRLDHLLNKDGLMVMGQYDSLRFSSIENKYETLTDNETLFKKL